MPDMSRGLAAVLAPAVFTLSTAIADRISHTHLSLLHLSIASGFIAVSLLCRHGLHKSGLSGSWKISALFSAAYVCSRIAGDRASTRWAASCSPMATFVFERLQQSRAKDTFTAANTIDTLSWLSPRTMYLAIASMASFTVMSSSALLPLTTLLAFSSSIFLTLAIVDLSEISGRSAESKEATASVSKEAEPDENASSMLGSWIGSSTKTSLTGQTCLFLRDVMAQVCGLTFIMSLWIEQPGMSPVMAIPPLHGLQNHQSLTWQQALFYESTNRLILGCLAQVVFFGLLLIALSRTTPVRMSLLYTAGVIAASLWPAADMTSIVLVVIYIAACALYTRLHTWQAAGSGDILASSTRMSARQLTWPCVLALLLFACIGLKTSSRPQLLNNFDTANEQSISEADVSMPQHPVADLVADARRRFEKKLTEQSSTLSAAVATYRHRYGLPPPPKFDMWFEFARSRNVQLIDEFDSIHQMLAPFWSLEPKVIRTRVAEALGFENSLMLVSIRGGQISHVGADNSSTSPDWHSKSIFSMIQPFVQHLPDMNLAFNLHDEPRVILPHDTLTRMMSVAQTESMPKALAQSSLTNAFSSRPKDMSANGLVPEVRATRFNKFSRQHTWSHSRLSCAPDSPSREYSDAPRDNTTAYATQNLGFTYNVTAFTDICQTSSLRNSFGFFDRPNVFNVVQDLLPIFSQSKISSFQDILYPSPWYWSDQTKYVEQEDHDWSVKKAALYWRGSTTGGFSRKGGWRRQHRQSAVRLLNEHSSASILSWNADSSWRKENVQRRELSDLVDVAFSHIGQCDPSDCVAQEEFFNVVPPEPQAKAWSYRLLLDIDGNAFSGRFIPFLRSRSLVLKMALFREWHADWLQPWLHYVPLSIKGEEWLETVRYLAGGNRADAAGEALGNSLANAGREWANKAMRKEDMEVWFFRLLLEYGRLIDDNRSSIGFSGY